jgi:hypothetical protein
MLTFLSTHTCSQMFQPSGSREQGNTYTDMSAEANRVVCRASDFCEGAGFGVCIIGCVSLPFGLERSCILTSCTAADHRTRHMLVETTRLSDPSGVDALSRPRLQFRQPKESRLKARVRWLRRPPPPPDSRERREPCPYWPGWQFGSVKLNCGELATLRRAPNSPRAARTRGGAVAAGRRLAQSHSLAPAWRPCGAGRLPHRQRRHRLRRPRLPRWELLWTGHGPAQSAEQRQHRGASLSKTRDSVCDHGPDLRSIRFRFDARSSNSIGMGCQWS